MASNFNIGILSELRIDTNSSSKSINQSITEIQKRIDNLKVELEVNATKTHQDSIKQQANSIIKQINTGKNLAKIKAEIDVNKTQSLANIKKSISELNTKLSSQKLKVNIDSNVNVSDIDKKTKAATSKASKNKVNIEVDNKPINQDIGRDSEKVKRLTSDFLSLKNAYKSYGDAVKDVNSRKKDNITYDFKDIKKSKDQIEEFIVTLRKYDTARNKIGQQQIKYALGDDGSYQLKNLSTLNSLELQRAEAQQKINKSRSEEIAKIEKMNQQGKINATQAQQHIQLYKQLNSTHNMSLKTYQQEHANIQKSINQTMNQNKLLKTRQSILAQLESAERRYADSIDKRKIGSLKKELNNDSFLNTKDAAFRMSQIQTSIKGITAEAERATRTQMGFIDAFRTAMVKFPVWMGATTLFFGAIRSGKLFIDTLREIDSQMITLAKVMPESTNLEEIFNNANEAALNYGQTISSVLDTYAEFARQGETGAELTQFGNAALIAANVGEIDAKQAAEYLTSMSAQWETTGKDAMRQVDSLNEISNNYATTVEKIAQGQAKAGSTAKSMGMSFDETNAVIGMLTAKTKQSGDEIGNFMKAVVPKLYVGKGADTIDELGIDNKNAEGQLKGAMELLEEVAQKIQGIDKDQQAAIVRGLGGTYHYQRMQVLLDDLAKADSMYKEIRETSENSGGSALAENAKYMESIEAKTNRAKVSIEQFAVALGDAFLKSGILEGIRVFTDSMTTLTGAITSVGSAAPLIGTLGAAVSLFSKNVRTGFEGARQSVADYVMEQNKLTAVQNLDGSVKGVIEQGASSSLVGVTKNQNGKGSDFTHYDQQASKAKAASIATYEFSKAQKEASISALTTSGAIKGNTVAVTANAYASKIAAGAINTLKLAFRGLLAATGVGLAISGVSFVLEKLVGGMDKAKTSAEQYNQANETLKQGLESNEAGHIDDLISKYDLLSQKRNSNDLNSDGMEQYKNTTSELANLFPDLVSGEDAYGKVISVNAETLRARVDIMQRQLDLQEQINQTKAKEETQDLFDTADNDQKEFERLQKRFQKLKDFDNRGGIAGGVSSAQGSDPAIQNKIADIDKLIRKTNDYETALKARNEAEDIRNQAKADGASDADLKLMDERLNKIKQLELASATAAGSLNAAMTAQTANFMTNISGIISKNQQLDTNTQSVFSSMANAVASFSKSPEKAASAMSALESKLRSDSGFKEKMASYEQAVRNFKEAADGSTQKAEYAKQVEEEYKQITEMILSMPQISEAFDKEGTKEFKDQLKLTIDSITNVGEASKKSANGVDEFGEAMQSAAQDAEEAKKANEDLGNSMKDAGDKISLINKAMGEMDEGELKYSTLTDLVSQYGEEVLVAGQNEADMMDFLRDKRHSELDDYNSVMQQKLETSAAVYEQLAGQGTALAEHMKETYGIDMGNYSTLAQFKSEVGQNLVEGQDGDQTKLINAIADYYGIDLSNYNSLAEKKEAVEQKLLEVVDEKWLTHLRSLANNINSIFGELESSSPLNAGAGSALNLAGGQGMPLFNDIGKSLQSGTNAGLYGNFLANHDTQFKQATSSLSDLSKMTDKLGEGLSNLGSPDGAGGKAAKGAKDAGKGAKKAGDSVKKATKETEKLKKEAEQAGVTVEKLYKTFQKQTYVADELSMALDKVNYQLELQQLNTQKYATWSQKYRDSLRQENKLIDEKTKKLNEQIKSMEAQIAAGKVLEYGLVSSDVNVPYYKYTANNMSGDQKGTISSLTGSSTQAKVWNNLRARGLTDAQVAGIMGNIERESKFNPKAKEIGGTGIGLVQWSFDRANNLKAYAKSRGKAWTDLQTQLDFLWHELNTSEIAALNALKKATSATSAANIFQLKYERAGVVAQGERNAAAKKYYNQFKGMSGSGGIVKGSAGTSIVNDNNTWMFDSQFGRYNNGGTHYGRDITGSNINGKTVKAARAGVVTFSGWGAGGNMLSIFDGQNTYTYMHLLKPAKVKKGQTVKAGQAVGQVGSTFGKGGSSSGPHLHVQVNKGKTPNGTFVNSFSGKHAAIDAKKAGYLKVAGSSGSSIASLIGASPASGAISADYVNDLNASEEQRLAMIEAIINEENNAQAMLQKVDELKKSLMDKQLEQARNSQQKGENLYNIHKSHVEEYDRWKELQQAKSARLEYELNKIEFEKGRNNQTWRDKNAQLQASRDAEKGFEEGKIKYINKAMKQNKKLFGKDTVYRDEFEKMKRDAQQSILDIKAGIQQANGEIAASIIDQILDDYEEAEKKLRNKIESLSKKKQYLDSESDSQAKKSVSYTKQQAEASTDLGLQIQFTIKELQKQQKHIKKNYELNKRVKDRITELKTAYEEAKLAAYQYRIEAADADIERQLNANAKALKKAQKDSMKAEYESSFINQDGQIDLWRKNQVEKLKGLNKERKALDKNKKELEAQLKLYKDMPTQARKIQDAIDEITNSVKESNKSIHQIRLDLSQSVINSIKTIYQKQLEVATKAYDDEYKEFEKLINKKLKLIDEEAQDETYQKDIADKTEELNKIRDEIAQRMGDDSLANQKKLKELREQLKEAEYDYDAYIRNKEREERKKALQEELEDKNEQIDKQKEDLNKAYTDLLEDTRKFNQIQEQLMEGQVNKYKSLIEELTKYVNDNMKEIGASVGQNMLDALNETFGTLEELTSQLQKYEKGDVSVPNSSLKPKNKPEVSDAAVKAVNSISPASILSGLSIDTPTLPKNATVTRSVTNNNSTQMEALVNIETFNGTEQEVKSLSDTLANEMKKRGLMITK